MCWYEILKDFTTPAVALIGLFVTGYFAYAGLRTFDRWKQEKLEEKRIDVAIDALAIGFEAAVVFDEIRSRSLKIHEYADLKTAGDDQPSRQQRGPLAILKRLETR